MDLTDELPAAQEQPKGKPKKGDMVAELKKRLAIAEAAAEMHAKARSDAEKARRLAEKEVALIKDELLKLTAG